MVSVRISDISDSGLYDILSMCSTGDWSYWWHKSFEGYRLHCDGRRNNYLNTRCSSVDRIPEQQNRYRPTLYIRSFIHSLFNLMGIFNGEAIGDNSGSSESRKHKQTDIRCPWNNVFICSSLTYSTIICI